MSNLVPSGKNHYFEQERRKAPKINDKGRTRIIAPDQFQEFLETHPEPWTQAELEPNDLYSMYMLWLSLPGKRTFTKLAVKLKAAGYGKYSLAWVQEIAQLYRWEFRTELYDAYMLGDYEEDIRLSSRMMKTRRVQIINTLMDKAEEVIETIDWSTVSAKTAVELLKVALSLGQLEFPETNPRVNVSINNNNQRTTQIANVSPQLAIANDGEEFDVVKELENEQKRKQELIRLIADNPQYQHALIGDASEPGFAAENDKVYPSTADGSPDEPEAETFPFIK